LKKENIGQPAAKCLLSMKMTKVQRLGFLIPRVPGSRISTI